MMRLLVVIVALVFGTDAFSVQRPACVRNGQRSIAMSSNKFADAQKSVVRALAAGIITAGTFMNDGIAIADSAAIEKVPLYTKKSNEVQAYSDINRGFRMLRPFGFNEFEGAGTGYIVKFASLFDVDENVVVGSAPATADKATILDYGSVEKIGEKLASKRGGVIKSAKARETEGIVFYEYEFENPLDMSLPRVGAKRDPPSKGIELYELCVAKGRLWSVQATSNDKLFPAHESTLRAAIASFIPKL